MCWELSDWCEFLLVVARVCCVSALSGTHSLSLCCLSLLHRLLKAVHISCGNRMITAHFVWQLDLSCPRDATVDSTVM